MDLNAVVAWSGLGLTVVGVWLTWLYGERTCALLKRRGPRDDGK
jgi:hypothetical protein